MNSCNGGSTLTLADSKFFFSFKYVCPAKSSSVLYPYKYLKICLESCQRSCDEREQCAVAQ